MIWELLWLAVVPVFLLWRAFCLMRAERYHKRLAEFLTHYFKDESIPDEDKHSAYAYYRFCGSLWYWLMFPFLVACTIVKGNRNEKNRSLGVLRQAGQCDYGDEVNFKMYSATLVLFAIASRPILACISALTSIIPILFLGVPAVLLSGSPEKLTQIFKWFLAALYSGAEMAPVR